jgi:myo-inositol 2-dehydrogenase / D-chiro-inositol 1-dehydrogenase
VARAVRERDLLTCVGYHWRSLSLVEAARAALAGRTPHLLTAQWLDSTPAAPWWSQRAGSGGQLVEQTTHLVDLARHLVGEVESVQALELVRERDDWPGADVPTASGAVLRFNGGAVGTVSSSCVLDRRRSVAVQVVAEGRLVELRERALSDHELLLDGEPAGRTDEDPIAREDRAFVDALRGAGPVPVPYEEGLRTHAAVWAADTSARNGGRPVEVAALLEQAPA